MMGAIMINKVKIILFTIMIFALFSGCGNNEVAGHPIRESEIVSDIETIMPEMIELDDEIYTSYEVTSPMDEENQEHETDIDPISEDIVVDNTIKPTQVQDITLDKISSSEYSQIPPFDNIASFYARNAENFTYVGGAISFNSLNDYYFFYSPLGIFIRRVIEGLTAFEGLQPLGSESQIYGIEFLIWTTDGVRHVYGIGQNGTFIINERAYVLPEESRQIIEELHSYMLEMQNFGFAGTYPQWLTWMTPSRITKMIFHSPTRGALLVNQAVLGHAARQIQMTPVIPTGAIPYALGSVDFSDEDVFRLEIHFNTGVIYNIYAINNGFGADYYVQSSDMSFGLRYSLASSSIHGGASHMIDTFEWIADSERSEQLYNPTTWG